ncbi:M3 family metallopeptidase [Uliginosibacterium sp. 31-16]|uniref:M3 family metallopeptidase n=1 Tax=Uliginosibacterium sp. 31-16 TaxID=3068315 RepID=UPI00273DB54E|nr:M3 family metallopeptidase [Uliginosibacterium sp. 31-16]MDP5238473.1 M3 family metallopeptidase [Uliginosibacterium sp. 31-16]
MSSPLLDFSSLPRFDAIQPADVAPAIQQLLADGRTLIARQTSDDVPATWADFVAPMIDAGERLSRAWGIVGHLHSVMDTPPWREAYNALLPEVTRYYSELGQNLALFAKYKQLRESVEYATLSSTRQRILDNEVRDFRLSGAELAEDQKPRFQAIQEELAALGAKFSENVLDATNGWTQHVTEEARLAGLPEDAKAAAAAAAERAGKPGWVFSLQFPSYFPVMQYAEDRTLREAMYRANATRASEFSAELGHAEWDNAPNIARIIALRSEAAKMLGYASYAEVSLVPKMAESPAQVLAFLRDLGTKAKPFAERDMAELRAFAAKELGLNTLEAWDIPWASEKLRQARYAYSDHEVKAYFPQPKVLAGLFNVVEKLFGVAIREDSAPVWHEDVRFFRIERAGQLVGQFYLDLYSRDTKRGGAWMDSPISRRATASGTQTPVAYLVCNFPGPVAGKPATFSHDDVQTLFHEAGHGLHHLLTRIDELWVSGISGVEWDAVELPSQFMENFCWEWDVLQGMTAHAETGEPLPRALFDKMLAAKNFQSGMQTVRQIEFSIFDLRLHHDWPFDATQGVQPLLDEVRKEFAVVFPPPFNRFANSFSHIFAGGYAAGYYSYKWAEVLSADVFAAFEEARPSGGSVFDSDAGARYLAEILSVGGSRPALASFKAFRGREPQVDALLRHSGMSTT